MAVNLDQIGTRLSFYMRIKGLDVFVMGERTGTSAMLISNIISGKNYCMDDLLAVLNKLPNLNSHWVIYGEGNIFKEQNIPLSSIDAELMHKNRMKHLTEMQKLLEVLDEIERTKKNTSKIDELKARITELTKEL
ncbi:hypothetical protein AHMF7605_10860 [Adhaeribacter arboris]|uniref:HTH cro/C1-type domain-containing protein n=1 Tax=Adhaeribacter arboris TaxID=2072846 RepID=A0A2T2YER8_9BACT|nr:hypothetical protein [Adhaeribacter arboris]PSR53983.1 hypothetical protein AHMF7605_10860 [Adhaeribacter arboris]